MPYREMFDPELISLEMDATSKEAAFELAACTLLKKGLVKESYLSGLVTREESFPTGLITQYLNIALPHTDSEHIIRPFVMIVRLKEEVTFEQMGDNQAMKTKDLFFLGIKDGKKQAGLLALFMDLFMRENFVKEYISADNPAKIYQLFETNA